MIRRTFLKLLAGLFGTGAAAQGVFGKTEAFAVVPAEEAYTVTVEPYGSKLLWEDCLWEFWRDTDKYGLRLRFGRKMPVPLLHLQNIYLTTWFTSGDLEEMPHLRDEVLRIAAVTLWTRKLEDVRTHEEWQGSWKAHVNAALISDYVIPFRIISPSLVQTTLAAIARGNDPIGQLMLDMVPELKA